MRVSLIKAPVGRAIGLDMITLVEPLGLACVAGALEPDGHACQVVDLRIDGYEAGFARLRDFRPDIIGVQCNFTSERFRVMDVVRRSRRAFPDALIMIGGHDASRDAEWFLKPGVDLIVVGDGEEVMPALVAAREAGRELRLVPGLVLNDGGHALRTPPAQARREMDDLPMPARHLIRHYADQYYINYRRPVALLETARGCPFRCNFCSVWKFHETSYREKSPQRVVRELEQIAAPNIFITDDIFWMNARRARELGHALISSGIRKHYNIQTRSDIICKFPDLVELWKRCGRMTVFLGLEKIDDAGLRSINKTNSSANNDRAIAILQEAGVGYKPTFIIDPGWEREDFAKLKRWIDATGAWNAGFSVLTPLPGTELWEDNRGGADTSDWELFDIYHSVMPTKLPLAEFYAEYAGLFAHAMSVRYRHEGKWRARLGLLRAIAGGHVSLRALRSGMRLGMGNVLSDPRAFLRAHEESAARLQRAAALSEPIEA
jgi:radical SAM superfamily enzyme YgiQ (UPF0313 family)